MKSPAGFTLIECLVAALVLSAGVLSVVASSQAIQQLGSIGRETSGASEAAANRLALLSASACASPVGGSALGRYDESWSVTSSGRLRTVALDLRYQAGHRPRTLHFDAVFLCPP